MTNLKNRRRSLSGKVTDHESCVRCIQVTGYATGNVSLTILLNDLLMAINDEHSVVELISDNNISTPKLALVGSGAELLVATLFVCARSGEPTVNK